MATSGFDRQTWDSKYGVGDVISDEDLNYLRSIALTIPGFEEEVQSHSSGWFKGFPMIENPSKSWLYVHANESTNPYAAYGMTYLPNWIIPEGYDVSTGMLNGTPTLLKQENGKLYITETPSAENIEFDPKTWQPLPPKKYELSQDGWKIVEGFDRDERDLYQQMINNEKESANHFKTGMSVLGGVLGGALSGWGGLFSPSDAASFVGGATGSAAPGIAGVSEVFAPLAGEAAIGTGALGGSMNFFDTLDSLLQGGYSNIDAWNMAEQLSGGADIGSMVDSFVAGEGAAPSWLQSTIDTVRNALGSNASPSSISSAVKSLLGGSNAAGLLGTGANLLGGYLQANQSAEAAEKLANAQIEAARIAADAAKFRPVGVSTRFGSSQFGYDDKGNLTSAGYTVDPTIRAQQDQLLATSGGMLNQFTGSQAATAPMGDAGARAMQLGQGYLATDPAAQAAKYMAEQQALLASGRERDFSTLQNKLAQQGRLGLATGGTSTGMMAANPEMEAYYNAIRQQDLGLAAQATQGGMDYAKFGAGMVGTGGDLLSSMYGTQANAFKPYQTALGGATYLEGLGQDAMDLGINLGNTATAANRASGGLLAQGMTNAAQTMQPTNANSNWANLLGGVGNYLTQPAQTGQVNQAFKYDPYTGRLLGT